MFPKIPKFKRTGKGGEHEIASVLGYFANIMSPEHDVGFDFLCELLENNQPHAIFFGFKQKQLRNSTKTGFNALTKRP